MTSPGETVLCHYRYDPLDRLISHTLTDIPERQRFYCKSKLTTEIQGAMRYSIIQLGDQLLAQQNSEGGAFDTTLLATDQNRSVLQTLNANSAPQPIAYSPYGHRPLENGQLSLLGFNGERPDPVTGCYLLGNGYRAFNPALMRFNSPDSWCPFGNAGTNSYTYCLDDPINRHDPNGHISFKTIGRMVVNIQELHKRAVGTAGLAPLNRIEYLSNTLLRMFENSATAIYRNDLRALRSNPSYLPEEGEYDGGGVGGVDAVLNAGAAEVFIRGLCVAIRVAGLAVALL